LQLAHRLAGEGRIGRLAGLWLKEVDMSDFVVAALNAERKSGGADDGVVGSAGHGVSKAEISLWLYRYEAAQVKAFSRVWDAVCLPFFA
jgi:hypothetical protein